MQLFRISIFNANYNSLLANRTVLRTSTDWVLLLYDTTTLPFWYYYCRDVSDTVDFVG